MTSKGRSGHQQRYTQALRFLFCREGEPCSQATPFLCTGVINPLHQISGTHPTVRIKLNSFKKQFSSIAKECLIISLETLSIPGDFPFFSDLTIFLRSAPLVNLLMNWLCSFEIFSDLQEY